MTRDGLSQCNQAELNGQTAVENSTTEDSVMTTTITQRRPGTKQKQCKNILCFVVFNYATRN